MANDKLEQKISTDFDKALGALSSIENANKARIPEELFTGVFLGLFANLDNQHPHATIQNWISIAGNPFSAVDVVANNEIIFTVPPIFSKEAINPQAMSRTEPLAHIVAIAEKLSLRSPIEGQNYIDNKYATASRNVRGNVNRIAYAKEWNTIFKRYGLPELVEMVGTVDNAPKPLAPSDIKDELRGDDLEFTPI